MHAVLPAAADRTQHMLACSLPAQTNAWFPALRCRWSVHIWSSSIFSVAVATKPGAPPTRMWDKLARQPTGACRAIRLYGANGNGFYGTALRNGSTDSVITETVTETDTDNGNVRWHCGTCWQDSVCVSQLASSLEKWDPQVSICTVSSKYYKT